MSYSLDDAGRLSEWWLIDLDKVRSAGILNKEWPTYPNGDGTSGMYIPINYLYLLECIVAPRKEVSF
jgi:hypothetical protein